MESALGGLGWSPSTFWAATPHELNAAIIGFERANTPRTKPDLPSKEGIEAIMDKFPDYKAD
jgi:uncharacterized phage protein (TIGR02216 family)